MEMTRPALEAMGMDAWIASRTPMRGVGDAQEVTNAVMFLASDLASYITGVDLLVDGGTKRLERHVPDPTDPSRMEQRHTDGPDVVRAGAAPARLVSGAGGRDPRDPLPDAGGARRSVTGQPAWSTWRIGVPPWNTGSSTTPSASPNLLIAMYCVMTYTASTICGSV